MARKITNPPRHTVYLDYAATTPVDPEVVATMSQYLGLEGAFGNPASRSHHFGTEAADAVESARQQVATLIHADPSEIIWTSGATESANLAIKGIAHGQTEKGKHLVTSALEHKAVLDSCAHLALEGFEITYVSPGPDGLICPERVKDALRPDTILVSLMHVNNEVGTITDVSAIGELTRAHGIPFHVDAAQSAPRLPLDTRLLQADLVSISAHKMYGPKGVGALYVRRLPGLRIQPQMHGGGQEHGLRSGTLPTHQIVGAGKAAELIAQRCTLDLLAVERLDRLLLDRCLAIEATILNGNPTQRVPGILNLCFPCVQSESLMLCLKEVAISSGSACTSARVESSHVLRSLGLAEDLASSSVRFSLGRFTTEKELTFAAAHVRDAVTNLRQLAPDWPAFRATARDGAGLPLKPSARLLNQGS